MTKEFLWYSCILLTTSCNDSNFESRENKENNAFDFRQSNNTIGIYENWTLVKVVKPWGGGDKVVIDSLFINIDSNSLSVKNIKDKSLAAIVYKNINIDDNLNVIQPGKYLINGGPSDYVSFDVINDTLIIYGGGDDSPVFIFTKK